MKKISTIVVDDEKQARNGLKVLLERDPEIEVLSFCSNGMEAIEQITRLQPQLLFLDIQMPEINGFDVIGSLPEHLLPAVIFATAYDKYALRAFEVHAIDYLLKPFTDKRFFQALEHAKNQIRSNQSLAVHQGLASLLTDYQSRSENAATVIIHDRVPSAARDRLVIKSSGKIQFIPLNHIRYLLSKDYYVTVFTDKSEYMVRESLKALLERLPEEIFLRIHRSHVINLNAIRTIEPYTNGDFHVTLLNGSTLRGSRKYRKALFEQFGLD